jgi:hypothetical protein
MSTLVLDHPSRIVILDAKGDTRVLTEATMSADAPSPFDNKTVYSATAVFTQADVGKQLVVPAAGPFVHGHVLNTKIEQYRSAHDVRVETAATGSAGAIVHYGGAVRADGAMKRNSFELCSASAIFSEDDVGKAIVVGSAGPDGQPLVNTIASFESSTKVTLTLPANAEGAVNAVGTAFAFGGTIKTDGAVAANSQLLASASSTFISADVGKRVLVPGAGVGGVPLITYISRVVDPTHAALALCADTTVSGVTFSYGGTVIDNGGMASGSATLVAASGPFVPDDENKIIIVAGAGTASGVLSTTISTFVQAWEVTLAASAGATAGALFSFGGKTKKCAIGSGSSELFSLQSPPFTGEDIGKTVVIPTAKFANPDSVTISGQSSATRVTLSQSAESGTGAAVTYGTDNRAVLVQAINEVLDNGGGVVSIPSGDYFIDTITWGAVHIAKSNLTIRGAGSGKTRLLYNGTFMIQVLGSKAPPSQIVFEGFTVTGTFRPRDASLGGMSAIALGARDSRLIDVVIDGVGGTGIGIGRGDPSLPTAGSGITISRCRISRCYEHCIYAGGVDNILIHDTILEHPIWADGVSRQVHTGASALNMASGEAIAVVVANCLVILRSLHATGIGVADTVYGPMTIANTIVHLGNDDGDAFSLGARGGLLITGCQVRGDMTGEGYVNTSAVVMKGDSQFNSGSMQVDGMRVTGTVHTPFQAGSVANCIFRNLSVEYTGPSGWVFDLQNSHETIVEGCQIPPGFAYGINLNISRGALLISNDNRAASKYDLSGPPTAYRIHDPLADGTVQSLAYGASINVNLDLGSVLVITANNENPFTIESPRKLYIGRIFTFHIINSSGGATGAITWASRYRLATTFPRVANAKSRTITFYSDGTNAWEVARSPGDDEAIQSLSSASSPVSIDLDAGTLIVISVPSRRAFRIANPTILHPGRTFTIRIRNTSGGAMGTITWSSQYKLAGAFINPADTRSRTITFYSDGTDAWEISRAAADI